MKTLQIQLLILMFVVCGMSQEKQSITIDFDWHEKSILTDRVSQSYKIIQSFKDAHIGGSNFDLPQFIKKIDLITDGEISVRLNPIKTELLQDYNIESFIGSEYEVITFVDQIRESYLGGIQLTPFRKVENGIERIIRAELEILIDYNLEIVNRGPERTFQSVLAEGAIYSIAVDQPGVFSLSRSETRQPL